MISAQVLIHNKLKSLTSNLIDNPHRVVRSIELFWAYKMRVTWAVINILNITMNHPRERILTAKGI